jgi:hypothetical protein
LWKCGKALSLPIFVGFSRPQAAVQQAMKFFGGCGILSHPEIFLFRPQAKGKLPCGYVENLLFIQITTAR